MKMNNKKVFLGIMGLLAMYGAGEAQAQTGTPVTPAETAVSEAKPRKSKADAVLFKIHDIVSISQNDGMYQACDFFVTFYNRSDKDINGATLNLTWKDDALEEIIQNEMKASNERSAAQAEGLQGDYVQSEDENVPSYTEKVSPQEISTTIEMPAVKAYEQVSVRSRLQTDRCFMLMNDVKTNVTSCLSENNNAVVAVGQDRGCAGLFHFVSAKNSEYYVEFKPVSYNDQQTQIKQKKADEAKEIEADYHRSVEQLEKASRTLAEIK